MQIVAPSRPKENRHETFDHLAIAARRFRRSEHNGSQCRRVRRRGIPGRLRRGGASCCRGCAASRRRRAASDCRTPKSILSFARCSLVSFALTLLLHLFPSNFPVVTISSVREPVIAAVSMKGLAGRGSALSCGDTSEVSEGLRIFVDFKSVWCAAAVIGLCYPTDPSGSFNSVSAAVALARFLRCKTRTMLRNSTEEHTR
jgi:hypothetical protein